MSRGFFHVRVGDNERPATKEDIQHVSDQINVMLKLSKQNPEETNFLVTNHLMTFEFIPFDPETVVGVVISNGKEVHKWEGDFD